MAISWSNLPALRRAGSRLSGLFVAPMIMTGLLSVLSHDRSMVDVRLSLLARWSAGL